jgi:hypothetical protein
MSFKLWLRGCFKNYVMLMKILKKILLYQLKKDTDLNTIFFSKKSYKYEYNFIT